MIKVRMGQKQVCRHPVAEYPFDVFLVNPPKNVDTCIKERRTRSVLQINRCYGRSHYMETVNNIYPGMRACDVFKLAEKETYRQDWNQFVPIEFVGHGIGTLNHEPPWLSEDDMTEIVPGMTLCIEVGCYDPELTYFGNMPEDIWLVTEDGLELLGVDLPRDVWLCT